MEGFESRHEAIELVLAKLLRVGSSVSATLIAAGIALTLTGIASSAATYLTTAGLVALVATPIIRVAVALLVFLRERDLMFAGFCLVVLTSLLVGVIIGQIH